MKTEMDQEAAIAAWRQAYPRDRRLARAVKLARKGCDVEAFALAKQCQRRAGREFERSPDQARAQTALSAADAAEFVVAMAAGLDDLLAA